MASAMAQPKKDAANCNDHPLFARYSSYWIESCIQKPSNSYKFNVGNGYSEVEGKYWYIRYQPPAGQTGKSTSSEVLRHFETAIKNQGGVLLYSDSSKETFKLTKNGKDNWVEAFADYTGRYILTIVEAPAQGNASAPAQAPSTAAKATDTSQSTSIATFDLLQALHGVQFHGLKVKLTASRFNIDSNDAGYLHFSMSDDIGDIRGSGTSLGIHLGGSPQPGTYQVGMEFRGAGVPSEVVAISYGGSVQTCPLPTTTTLFRCMVNITLPAAGSVAFSRQSNNPNAHSGDLEIMNIVVSAQPDLPEMPPGKK